MRSLKFQTSMTAETFEALCDAVGRAVFVVEGRIDDTAAFKVDGNEVRARRSVRAAIRRELAKANIRVWARHEQL